MPKNPIKVTNRLGDSEYPWFPAVIDITMGEFAFSKWYPLHSDSYATCLGVVVGAVEGSGVCLGHIDPIADTANPGTLYKNTLDSMIGTVLKKTPTAQVDVLFFRDVFQAVEKYDLIRYVELRHGNYVRAIDDRTDARGSAYDEVVAMPSRVNSAFVCLKQEGESWDFKQGKHRVFSAQTERSGNQEAERLQRLREVTFLDEGPLEGVVGEVTPDHGMWDGVRSFLGFQ